MTFNVLELGQATFPYAKQRFTPTKALLTYAIRPHLYKHGSVSGSLWFDLEDANGNKIASSETKTIASVFALGKIYEHGFYQFLLTAPLKSGVPYYLEMKSSGYSYSNSAFVGWVNQHGFYRNNATYTSPVGVNAPLDFELWTYENFLRGQS